MKMKKSIILIAMGLILSITSCNAGSTAKPTSNTNSTSGNVIVLTNEEFKQKVFNYEANKE
jgi:hypothetical protein